MGGCGSSRWGSHTAKDKGGSQSRIDVRLLHKRGWLEPGLIVPLSWTRRGEPAGSIKYVSHADRIELFYKHRWHGGEWEDVHQTVPLERTPCHYGGSRPWLKCPCGRRVAILYGAGKLFRCRHCYDLSYETRQSNMRDRSLLKAQKIREGLGGSGNMFDLFPPKPKWMRWKTYNRLEAAQSFEWRKSLYILNQGFKKREERGQEIFKEWERREARREKREARKAAALKRLAKRLEKTRAARGG